MTATRAVREIRDALTSGRHVIAVGPPGDCAAFANRCRSAGWRPRSLVTHGAPSVILIKTTNSGDRRLVRRLTGASAVPGSPDVLLVGQFTGAVTLPTIFADALKMINKSAKGSAPSVRSDERMKSRTKVTAKRPAPSVVKQAPSLERTVLRRMLASHDPVQREAARGGGMTEKKSVISEDVLAEMHRSPDPAVREAAWRHAPAPSAVRLVEDRRRRECEDENLRINTLRRRYGL